MSRWKGDEVGYIIQLIKDMDVPSMQWPRHSVTSYMKVQAVSARKDELQPLADAIWHAKVAMEAGRDDTAIDLLKEAQKKNLDLIGEIA